MEHFRVACEPYKFEKEDPRTGEIESKVKYSDMIDEDKALLHLVNLFVKQNPKHIQDQEAKNAREAKREAKLKLHDQKLDEQMMANQQADDVKGGSA